MSADEYEKPLTKKPLPGFRIPSDESDFYTLRFLTMVSLLPVSGVSGQLQCWHCSTSLYYIRVRKSRGGKFPIPSWLDEIPSTQWRLSLRKTPIGKILLRKRRPLPVQIFTVSDWRRILHRPRRQLLQSFQQKTKRWSPRIFGMHSLLTNTWATPRWPRPRRTRMR